MGLYHPSVSKYLLSSESRRDSTGKKLPPARVLGAAGTLVVQRAADRSHWDSGKEKKKKNRIMATPRMNEEFKRGEGVADASLADSEEWTGSSGCKATPRGIWSGLLELHMEKQRNTDRTQSSVSSASVMTEILWVVCLWSVAAPKETKKRKKKKKF